jgi:hypothetical protein
MVGAVCVCVYEDTTDKELRFDVATVVTVKITVFYDVAPCSHI